MARKAVFVLTVDVLGSMQSHFNKVFHMFHFVCQTAPSEDCGSNRFFLLQFHGAAWQQDKRLHFSCLDILIRETAKISEINIHG